MILSNILERIYLALGLTRELMGVEDQHTLNLLIKALFE